MGNAYDGIMGCSWFYWVYRFYELHSCLMSLVQALDAAIQHYEADMQKRSARSGERPNGYA